MNKRFEWLLVGALCAVVGWFYVWTAYVSGDPWRFGQEQRDYYNWLIDGWLEGQLHMKVEVSPEMLRLKDPYDPTLRPAGVGLHDASFFQGKYYVYFGLAPVVLTMLPFRLLTGVDLPLAAAVLAFAYGGFLASTAAWFAVRRRYFPEAGAGVSGLVVIALGLAGLGPMLLRRPHMWELPIAGGYCLAMLALLCVWRSLHADGDRAHAGATRGRSRALWFGAAGLCLALAIASRPTYLLATPLLLALPLLGWWRSERRLPWRLALAAAVPLACVGSLMALHNYLRFGNPLEFGQAYQLSFDYESKMRHFSASYAPFNAWRYFFSPAQWTSYFPFITPAELPPKPRGFSGHDDVYGVLVNLPFAWLALAAPLALWRRDASERVRLGVWLGAAGVLFAVMTGVLLCFFGSLARYQLDFTPTLMLLAGVGVLAIERWARAGRPIAVQRTIRGLWGATAVLSAGFAVLFSLQLDGILRERNPVKEHETARLLNRIPAAFERLFGVRHGAVELTVRFRPAQNGERVLLTVGDAPRVERIFVRYVDAERVQLGFARLGAPEIVSRPLPWDFAQPHTIHVRLGSLLPPATHPFFNDMNPADAARLTRQVRIDLDGETLVDEPRRFSDTTGKLRVGAGALANPEARFDGELIGWNRLGLDEPAGERSQAGFVRLRLSFPERPTRPREPLVGFGQAGEGWVVFEHHVGDRGQLAFGISTGGEPLRESNPMTVDLTKVHDVIVRWTTGTDPTRRRIEMRLDDTIVFVRETARPRHEPAMAAGKNVSREPGCAPEFTGIIHSVQRSADGRDPLFAGGDTLRLRVRLPRDRTSRKEPLVVTGRTEAADLLLIEYLDAASVRFILEHWGGPTLLSEPVRLADDGPHELEITMTSLAAPADPGLERPFRKGTVGVVVNGREVWRRQAGFFTAAADEVAIGHNPIGGTVGGPRFTGDVLAAERVTR